MTLSIMNFIIIITTRTSSELTSLCHEVYQNPLVSVKIICAANIRLQMAIIVFASDGSTSAYILPL
jgi:hypothetical protein